MHPAIRIIIAAAIGAAAWAVAAAMPQIPPVLLFIAAAVIAALLPATGSPAPTTQRQDRSPAAKDGPRAATDGPREEGLVKWFNVSKGFGFITKDDGEEIFVHFRSIRGEGRRGLRDGQRVSFVEAQTDKGPQAEDVEPL